MALFKRRPDTGKAAPGPTMVPLGDVLAALTAQQTSGTAAPAEPLPRPDAWFDVPFNPGRPFTPAPVNAPRDDTGRPEPRLFEYPVSWNLRTGGERLVPWATLRAAADMPIVRQCIGHRQKELTALDWDITVSQGAIEEAQAAGVSKAEATGALMDKLAPEIKRLVEFWQTPDPEQGLEFNDWLWQLVEEQLTLDAVAIYPRFTYGGDLIALRTIDGTTIKPLLDENGGRPQPPFPAYQQVLYGFPRGEFTADVDSDGQMPGLSADHLIYRRRGIRTWTPYGYSPVEQALVDIDLYLKRHGWMRAEYTEGSVPAMVLKNLATGGSAQWTPRQTLDYERDYNDALSGQTAARLRARILPPGLEPAEMQGIPEQYRPDYDLHLIKLVASHLGVPITELGFTESKGLGSSGLHEGQATVNYRGGTLPDARWWQKLFTRIMRIHLGAPAELEFKFLGLDEEDEGDADSIAEARVRSGRMTVNEDRDRLGMPRFAIPEADTPMVVTNRGVVPLEGALAAAEAATQAAKQPPPPVRAPGTQADPGAEGEQPEQGDEGEQVAKAQLATFRRWARKNHAGRRFEFTADQALLTKLAPDLAADERVTFKAGGAGPKASWPGWDHDQALAAHYSHLIGKALAGAVDATQLAARWQQTRKTADPAQPAGAAGDAAAQQWLESLDIAARISAALRIPLLDLWTEAYLVGQRSAQAMHLGTAADWGSWKPGNPQAARLLIGGDRALQDLLDHYNIPTIRAIAKSRLGDMAVVLAESLRDGWSPGRLATELRGVLDDPSRADMIATTETARGQSQGSMRYYQGAGIDAVEWWIAPTDACPICTANAEQGPIRRGQHFSSGEDAPPAHPRCRCSIVPAELTSPRSDQE